MKDTKADPECGKCKGTGWVDEIHSASENMPKDTPTILMPIGLRMDRRKCVCIMIKRMMDNV
jgi:hypothetical protein